jgi:DNA modification methylase
MMSASPASPKRTAPEATKPGAVSSSPPGDNGEAIAVLRAAPDSAASQPSALAGTVFSNIPNESFGFTSKSTIDRGTFWSLYHADFRNKINDIASASVDLVYTDLPYGVNLDKMSRHAASLGQYSDSRTNVVDMLTAVARESFRILKLDRFAVFWFGFNYYQALLGNLEAAGFTVIPVPIIWLKHRASTENPNTRYANAYEAALYAVKGSPILLNPGRHNVVDVPTVAPGAKLQAAQQPLALPLRFISDMVAPGATVVDLCAGVGTTLEAALRYGCRAIGFEKDIISYEIAKARLSAL